MAHQQRMFRWGLLGVLGILMLVWGMVGCGNPTCSEGQALVEGKCITVSEPTTEVTPEVSPEPASEPGPEPSKEEPVVEEGPEPGPEVGPEPGPEPTKPDASEPMPEPEPTVEMGPEVGPEPGPEPTPEPTGPVPTISIKSPKDGDLIKDASVEIEVDAQVGSGGSIDYVELQIDGTKWSDARQTPYRFSIPKGSLTDGEHTVKAIVVTTGYQQATDEIKIKTAANGPQIKILQPTPDSSVSAAFTISVEVKTGLALKQNGVKLLVNGKAVAWTKTTPNYEATFDPKDLPFDSFPIQVTATDEFDFSASAQVVVVHDPKPGPKKLGEECDNTDAQKRCVANHSCLNIDGTFKCYENCTTGQATNPCQNRDCKVRACQSSHMGTKRGVCYPTGPAPGCLNYECTSTQRCNAGLICVGAGSGSTIRRWCMATCTPGNVLLGCKVKGHKCVNVGSTGACIEVCQQDCKQDSECGLNQTCNSGKCGGPFCQHYGAPCRAVQAGTETFNACI